MTVYEAIAKMRELTKQGQSFSFTFMSYSHYRGETKGIIEVQQARLRPRNRIEHNQYAELQEEYINVKTGEPRRFWHCCLLSLNGQSLTFTPQDNDNKN